jgi:hypothetical protein
MKSKASYPQKLHPRSSRASIQQVEKQLQALLPDLDQGHAPITLHHAFHDALELFEDWPDEAGEPAVYVEGKTVPISLVFAQMVGCTDLMPRRTKDVLAAIASSAAGTAGAEGGDIYSRGARLMLSFWEDRLPGIAEPERTKRTTFVAGQTTGTGQPEVVLEA